MRLPLPLGLVVGATAHSSLIYPKPRNAIDSLLPDWANGTAPTTWQDGLNPCACKNGTDVCDVAQACLWMSVGCSIGVRRSRKPRHQC